VPIKTPWTYKLHRPRGPFSPPASGHLRRCRLQILRRPRKPLSRLYRRLFWCGAQLARNSTRFLSSWSRPSCCGRRRAAASSCSGCALKFSRASSMHFRPLVSGQSLHLLSRSCSCAGTQRPQCRGRPELGSKRTNGSLGLPRSKQGQVELQLLICRYTSIAQRTTSGGASCWKTGTRNR
jgi:hypothetical protein